VGGVDLRDQVDAAEAGEHQVYDQEIGLGSFNLVQGCPLAVGDPDQLDTGYLIQLGAQVFTSTGISVDDEYPDGF
jgi:hypothetical protein